MGKTGKVVEVTSETASEETDAALQHAEGYILHARTVPLQELPGAALVATAKSIHALACAVRELARKQPN